MMKLWVKTFFIVCSLQFFGPTFTYAQVFTDTLSEAEAADIQKRIDKGLKQLDRKYTLQVLPLIYYTPETRMAFGAMSIVRFKFKYADSLLKVSNITPSFVYTQNEQMLAQVNFDLYTNKKWRFFGNAGYFIYPYFFNGVGNTLAADEVEWYDATYPKINLNVYRKLWSDSVSVGVKYAYQNSKITPLSNQVLDTGNYEGANGSVQSSIGVGVRYDSRSHLLSATSGWLADVSVNWTDEWSGATYKDQFILADIRTYIPVFKKKDIIALQVYTELHTGKVPFNLMSLLGGSEHMRGYREGEYRDRQMWVYQVEYRTRLFFKFVGLAAFVNMGGIGNDFEDVNQNYRFTYGGGLRIAPVPNERYFIRLDYGVNETSQGLFYIAIGEAF
ncbi:MAG: outer membrane protein assembly factor BamA [Salibacteraceae bacterium]|jgi:outer membrane protein assembly factor BamA